MDDDKFFNFIIFVGCVAIAVILTMAIILGQMAAENNKRKQIHTVERCK